jgi:hypothetical protein
LNFWLEDWMGEFVLENWEYVIGNQDFHSGIFDLKNWMREFAFENWEYVNGNHDFHSGIFDFKIEWENLFLKIGNRSL